MIISEQKFESARELLAEDLDKFEKRYATLYGNMQAYIKESGYNEMVQINEIALADALVDYFVDIRRLKSFHKIEHINSIKLISYTSYWILRRKPLQIISNDREAIYANEHFVLAYILSFLNNNELGFILERNEVGLKSFLESLFYFLKFRQFNAQDLEMVLLSFFAGQIYQSKDNDLSYSLPILDNSSEL